MIPEFVKSLLANPLIRARVQKAIRAASLAAGTWALTSTYVWITTHIAAISQTDAATIAGVVSAAAAGLVMSVGSAFYGIVVDPKTVDAKIKTAALTGSVAAANDKGIRAAVTAASGSPEALQQLQATLKAGQE